MFDGSKYITSGIKGTFPIFMQNILWYLIESMEIEEKDYLQVFQLSVTGTQDQARQFIVHYQEQPLYRKEYTFNSNQCVSGKVYVIDDGNHCTMLLADEY